MGPRSARTSRRVAGSWRSDVVARPPRVERSVVNPGQPGRAALAGCAIAAATALAPAAFAEINPLTLYQRAGRAPWVILGEVQDANDRFPVVKVVEIFKGEYARETIRIVHRLENFTRESWEGKIGFTAGEQAVFFLKRPESDRKDGKLDESLRADDIFAQASGAQGKMSLPEEGSAAYLSAIREFVRVTSIIDPVARDEALLAFLISENPHVQMAGLEQTIERRLALDTHAPLLLSLSDSPRDPVKLNALQALVQVAEDLRAAGKTLPDQANIVNALKGKVAGAGGDVYRVEALRAVAALAGASERAFFELLSKEDPSQLVRYEAARAVLALAAH